MTARIDIHSPKNLVTEDYEDIWYGYNHIDGMPGWVVAGGDHALAISRRIAVTDHLGRGTHQCHHCGARMNYFVVLEHRPTGDLIVVGETCMGNRFDRSTGEFQKMRKAAELNRKAQRIKKAAAEWMVANDEAAKAINAGAATNTFLADLARKLLQYGSLSENQAKAAIVSYERDLDFAAKKAWQALLDFFHPPTPPAEVPEGRHQVTGTVLKTVWRETDFGSVLKLTVKDDTGFRVYVSAPSKLPDVEAGDRIQLTAALTRSHDDPTFGFGKRPTQAKLLETIEDAETPGE